MEDAGKLVLRLTVGGLLLLHGIAKLRGGVAGIEAMLDKAGLPGWLALGAYVGEVIAPILVMLGVGTRVGAAIIVVQMLFAIGLAHTDEILVLGPQGGWAIELQAFYLLGAVAIALLGPGRARLGPG